jgi:hypothetical protein
MPLRRLLLDLTARRPGPIAQKLDHAIEAIDALRGAKAAYLERNPAVAPRLDKLKGMSRAYLAHEYLNADWRPEYFADVARDLQEAKCQFVGSAHLSDHVDGLNLTPEMIEIVAAEGDPLARESLRDFLVNQEFRRDVYAKGTESHTGLSLGAAWTDLRLALVTPRAAVPMKTTGRLGELNLLPEVYDPLLDAFAAGARTGGELMAIPALAQLGWPRVREAIVVLVGAGQLQPCVPEGGDGERAPSTKAFNTAVMKRAEASSDLATLASPVTGGGVAVDRISQLFAAAHLAGRTDAPEWIQSLLESQGQRLLKDGQPLQGKDEVLRDLAERREAFEHDTLPLLRQLGVVQQGGRL